MTFRVGMKVCCIKYNPYMLAAPPIKVGGVYTVTWVGISEVSGKVMIDLLEYPLPETDLHYRGYVARHFRPLVSRTTDISFTQGAPKDSEQFDNRRKVGVEV